MGPHLKSLTWRAAAPVGATVPQARCAVSRIHFARLMCGWGMAEWCRNSFQPGDLIQKMTLYT